MPGVEFPRVTASLGWCYLLLRSSAAAPAHACGGEQRGSCESLLGVGSDAVCAALSERSDRLLVLVINLKEGQEAAHAQSLRDNLRQTGELHVSPGWFAGLENLDEKADAAGIEPVDACEVEDEPNLTVGNQVIE